MDSSETKGNRRLFKTAQRPHWLAGAPGFEPGNGGIASCGAGTAAADLTVTGLAKALPYSWAEQESSIGFPAIRVFRARGLHAASGQDESIRTRR
jgi:hypothetical protein